MPLIKKKKKHSTMPIRTHSPCRSCPHPETVETLGSNWTGNCPRKELCTVQPLPPPFSITTEATLALQFRNITLLHVLWSSNTLSWINSSTKRITPFETIKKSTQISATEPFLLHLKVEIITKAFTLIYPMKLQAPRLNNHIRQNKLIDNPFT